MGKLKLLEYATSYRNINPGNGLGALQLIQYPDVVPFGPGSVADTATIAGASRSEGTTWAV